MKFEEKAISKETVYNGKIINLCKDTVMLPNGKQALREVVKHPGGVCVAALTDKQEILLVSQFRYPVGDEILEVPAGKLTKGEDPLCCGKRELHEETGASAKEYTDLGQLFPSPGYTDEIIYIYLAKGLTYGEQDPDDDEFLDVVKMPLETAVEKVLSGEIKDAKSQAAILKTWLFLQREKTSAGKIS